MDCALIFESAISKIILIRGKNIKKNISIVCENWVQMQKFTFVETALILCHYLNYNNNNTGKFINHIKKDVYDLKSNKDQDSSHFIKAKKRSEYF